jgi:hypothetical protein
MIDPLLASMDGFLSSNGRTPLSMAMNGLLRIEIIIDGEPPIFLDLPSVSVGKNRKFDKSIAQRQNLEIIINAVLLCLNR